MAIRRISALWMSAERGVRTGTRCRATSAALDIAAITASRSHRFGEYHTTTEAVRG